MYKYLHHQLHPKHYQEEHVRPLLQHYFQPLLRHHDEHLPYIKKKYKRL